MAIPSVLRSGVWLGGPQEAIAAAGVRLQSIVVVEPEPIGGVSIEVFGLEQDFFELLFGVKNESPDESWSCAGGQGGCFRVR